MKEKRLFKMRGRGEYQRKMARETASIVYWAIWEFGAIGFNGLYKVLKSRGKLNNKRSLAKALRYLLKRGLIRREIALLHLNEKTVLNPPVLGQTLSLGRYENGKFIPAKTAPQKLAIMMAGKPTLKKSFQAEVDKVLKGARWVYVPRIDVDIRG